MTKQLTLPHKITQNHRCIGRPGATQTTTRFISVAIHEDLAVDCIVFRVYGRFSVAHKV
jgi:hypothetical protein